MVLFDKKRQIMYTRYTVLCYAIDIFYNNVQQHAISCHVNCQNYVYMKGEYQTTM